MNLAGEARHKAARFGTPGFRTAVGDLQGLDVRREPSAGGQHRPSDEGYAMAALLVAMSVMAVLMSVAMPTWSHMIRREKEEELIFRGNQYARAIGQYQRKYASASPPSLDILIEQRLLRKKYKDPLSPNEDGEFELLYVSTAGSTGRSGTGSQTGGVGPLITQRAGSVLLGTKPTGSIMGVVSKNTGESIRVFNGKNHYNEWQFVAMQQSTQAGAGAGGAQLGSGRGTGQGRGAGPGGTGTFTPADRGGSGMQPPGRGGQQQQGGRGFSSPPVR